MPEQMTLDLSQNPIAFTPELVTITEGESVQFLTSDSSSKLIDIKAPTDKHFDVDIPGTFEPSEGGGNYKVTYNHKGGIASGLIRVTHGT